MTVVKGLVSFPFACVIDSVAQGSVDPFVMRPGHQPDLVERTAPAEDSVAPIWVGAYAVPPLPGERSGTVPHPGGDTDDPEVMNESRSPRQRHVGGVEPTCHCSRRGELRNGA